MKVVESIYCRGPYWTHSNWFRKLLARFIGLKPNKYVPGDVFLLPDDTLMVSTATYKYLQEQFGDHKSWEGCSLKQPVNHSE